LQNWLDFLGGGFVGRALFASELWLVTKVIDFGNGERTGT
jgi:hypothetical protein